MFLAIDLGNSRAKVAIINNEDNNKFIFNDWVTSKPLDLEDLALKLNSFLEITKVKVAVVSSVVTENNQVLGMFLKNHFNITVYFITPKMLDGLILYNQNTVGQVGADILCKSVWIANKIKEDALIIDMGTATVVQYVNKSGWLNAAAITLGLASMYKELYKQTSLLPLVDLQPVENLLGTDTISAIQGGVFWGYVGLINNLAEKACAETKCNNIFLTGGAAKFIKNNVNFTFTYNQYIILESIAIIYAHNLHRMNN
ncbi:Type III pantothenate kinase [Candidatus Hepatincolaceae symbiont of Richtersius coronifer]